MQVHLIACDDEGTRAAVGDVAAAVRRCGESWTRVLDTVWYVRTPASAEELAARFAAVVGDDDGLVIQPIADEPVLFNTVRRWFPGEREQGTVVPIDAGRSRRLAA